MKRAALPACVAGLCLTVALCAPSGWLQVAAITGTGIALVMVVVVVFTHGGPSK